MDNNSLHGVIAAIATPFTPDGEPDTERFVTFARWLLHNGCDGLNVCGTTGEATSMSVDQRRRLMTAAAKGLPKGRLMVGTGAAAVADAVALTRHAADLGFAGALLLPPFYYKGVPDEGVVDAIAAVAAATSDSAIPLYLYNFPAMTGIPYSPEIVSALQERAPGRIKGLKDSSGDLAYARSIAALGDIDVFPSNEATLMETRNGVFAGCISATANVNSTLCARAYRQGDEDALRRAAEIRRIVSARPLIPAIKALVARMTGEPSFARPLPPMRVLQGPAVETLASEVDAHR